MGFASEDVSFIYPGSKEYAVQNITFHLKAGEKLALVGENGSGKTTLIKLLTRLYSPTQGRILFDGLDLQAWDQRALHDKLGVIFQDFVRYQLSVGENVGVGDVAHLEDEAAWREAADKGMALSFIEEMPDKFRTQLGRWFKGGESSLWDNGRRLRFPAPLSKTTPSSWFLMNRPHRWTLRPRRRSLKGFKSSPMTKW